MIDNVVEDMMSIFDEKLEDLCRQMKGKLDENSLETASMIESTIKENVNAFQPLKSEYLQNSYFKDHLGLVVSISIQL